jgi:hypothetical protein
VALTRTVQDAQVAGAAAAAEAAREAAESNDASSGGGGGGGGDSDGPTFQRFEPVMPPGCTRLSATSWSCPSAPGDLWEPPTMVPVG